MVTRCRSFGLFVAAAVMLALNAAFVGFIKGVAEPFNRLIGDPDGARYVGNRRLAYDGPLDVDVRHEARTSQRSSARNV